MKKVFSLCLTILMSLASMAQSHHLTAEQAMQRVGLQPSASSLGTLRRAPAAQHAAPADDADALYYIFDTAPAAGSGQASGGFIIVSADDRARPILGRCDEAAWDPDNIPPAMQGWLDNMAEALRLLAESADSTAPTPSPSTAGSLSTTMGSLSTTAGSLSTTKGSLSTAASTLSTPMGSVRSRSAAPMSAPAATRVAPLLRLDGEGEILWGQNTPYSNLCPASGSTHSATGCAATAMAQIMRYHCWPLVGHGSNSYDTSTIGDNGSRTTVSETFEGTQYDWANMLTAYYLTGDGRPSNYNDTQAAAVATLMRHIGVACDMDYNTGASGTTEGPMLRAMTENFDYDRSLQIYYRENYSSADWYALLQSEIDAQRPVLMNGYSISGGHAFVIDGYDTTMGTGYFHFNWGWNGMSNGYYSVDVCDPGEQGTGGSLGGYSYNQNIFTNIKPQAGGSASANLCVSAALRYDSFGQLNYQWLNRGTGAFTGDTGYVIDDGGQLTFHSVKNVSGVGFREGSGSVHQKISAPTKAGLRYYLASKNLRGTITAMRPLIGSAAALVSVEDGKGGYTLVPESAGMADLTVSSLELDGYAYAGATTNFTVTVTNNGGQEYAGALYMCVTQTNDAGDLGYPDLADTNPLGIYLRPGETGTYSFPFYSPLATGKYLAEVFYNPRNGSGPQLVGGATLTFDVVPYGSHNVEKDPPVISIVSRELSLTTVEQGGELTVNTRLNNKGGLDLINIGAAIFDEKGNKPVATLGLSSQSIVKEMSDHAFTGTIDLAPGRYRLLLGYEDGGIWEFFDWNYLYFTVVEPKTEPDPEDPAAGLPEYTETDVLDCDQDYDGDIDTDDLGYLVQDVLDGSDAKSFPWDDLNHDNRISIGDIVRFIYIMNSEAAKQSGE